MELILNKVVVKDSPIHGRGVFATENIKAGEVIEECHHVLLSESFPFVNQNLKEYVFAWPKFLPTHSTVVLGFGSIYNHSNTPNADWETDIERNLFVFNSRKDIAAGEEICTSYGEEYLNVLGSNLK